MSSSQSREVLFPSISQSSCLTELLYVIRLSFDSEEIKEAERILIRREEDFRNQVRDLKTQVENLQKERNLLFLTQLEKIDLEKDLEKCEAERKELNERVDRLVEERGSLIDSKIQAEERYMKAMEVRKRVESEGRRNMQELTWKIEKLKEEFLHYQDHQHHKEGKVLIMQPTIRALEWYQCTSSTSDKQLAKRIRNDGGQFSPTVEVSELSLELTKTPGMTILPSAKGPMKVHPHFAKRIRADEDQFSPAVEVSEPSLELTTTPEVIILPSTEGPLKVHPHSDHYITKEAVQSIPHFINKEIIQEEGMEPTLVPYYARLVQWNWGRLLGQPEHYAVEHLIREFFCNARHSPYKAEASVYCRGCVVPISPLKINQYMGTASIPREQDPLVQLQDRGIEAREEILDALALPGTVWPIHKGQHNQFLGQFMESSYRTTSMKVLHRWVTKTLVPSGDPSMVTVYDALVCYCIHMDRRFDVGRLIYGNIRRMARGPKKKVLGFPHLITSLCRRVNVCIDEATGLKQPPKPTFDMGCGAAQEDPQEDQAPAVLAASEPPKPAVGMGCGAAQDDPQEDQTPVVPPAPEPPKLVVGMGCGVAQEDPQEDQAPSVPLALEPGPSAAPELVEPPASDILTTSPAS